MRIIELESDYGSYKFLPMLTLIGKQCRIANELRVESEMTQEQRLKLKSQQNQNEATMAQLRSTDIVNCYFRVIDSNHCIKILPFLSSLIKEFVEALTTPLIKQRSCLSNQSAEDNKDEIREQVSLLNAQIQQKRFSQEFVAREIYYNSLHSAEKEKNRSKINSHYQQLMSTSQPFEVIDGDTLEFISQIPLLLDDDVMTLIVSVVGPQSSGKSFIMNYLFGTLFMSAAGRCTKGVYGSVLTLRCALT